MHRVKRGVTARTYAPLMVAALAASATLASACGGSTPTPAAPLATTSPAANAKPAEATPDDLARLKRFHSKRFNLSLALPNGAEWRIDDHSRAELVATHAQTSSKVVMFVAAEKGLTTRQSCEAVARERKLVPGAALRTVEDANALMFDEFDTRVWVAIEPAGAPGGRMVGHVLAFGGFLRKCFFFHYETEVASDADEETLSSRLAFARTRVLDGIVLEPFAAAPRETLPTSR